jgi:predicted transcriptional regulator of viral defense system
MEIKARTYIDHLSAYGKFAFTTNKIVKGMQTTKKAVERSIYRLKQKREITNLVKGYYLILTPTFRNIGCLPPDYFIDNLMKYWNQPYYVCLLSAAMCHDASHQKPQVFQVMVDKFKHSIICGRVRIEFILKKNLNDTPISKWKTHTGYMNISTPEATMIDLCTFIKRSGGISHVTTVLDELVEAIRIRELKRLLKEKSPELPCLQRLGYLLDKLEYNRLSSIIYLHLKKHKTRLVSLVPHLNRSYDIDINTKWKVAVNAVAESDLRGSY